MITEKMLKLFRYEARRNIYMGIIAFIGLFYTLPINLITQIATPLNRNNALRHNQVDFINKNTLELNYLTYQNIAIPLVLGFLAIAFGILLFSFLTSGKKTDFYFSQPLKRKSLFWIQYLQGVMSACIPYLLCILCVIGIASFTDCSNGNLVYALFQTFGMNLLFFLSMYSLTVLACCLTGNVFYSLGLTGIFLVYFPELFEVFSYIFDGHINNAGSIIQKSYNLSPIGLYYSLYSDIDKKLDFNGLNDYSCIHLSWKIVLAMFLMFLIGMLASLVLFCRRKAETAGKPVAFLQAKKLLKGFLVVLVSMGSSVLFPFLFQSQTTGCRIVGFVIGLLVSIYIIDTLMELNWSASFQAWKTQWVYVVIAVLFTVSFYEYNSSVVYHGFDSFPSNYTEDLAIRDGSVILENGILDDGIDIWEKFEEKVNHGKNAKVRVFDSHLTDSPCKDYVYKNGKLMYYTVGHKYGEPINLPYIRSVTGILNIHDKMEERTIHMFTDKKDITFQEVDDFIKEKSSHGDFTYFPVFVE